MTIEERVEQLEKRVAELEASQAQPKEIAKELIELSRRDARKMGTTSR